MTPFDQLKANLRNNLKGLKKEEKDDDSSSGIGNSYSTS
jgi:hypothetical protein